MMKRHVLLLLSLCTLMLHAQPMGMQWMGMAGNGNAREVWFRRVFLFRQKPQEAHLIIVSKGSIRAFVNGFNVNGYDLKLQNEGGEESLTVKEYDVSRYMKADSNVVALCCTPPDAGTDTTQVAVCLSGKSHAATPYSFGTETGWSCRWGRTTFTGNSENIDGRAENDDPTAPVVHDALWQPVIHSGKVALTTFHRERNQSRQLSVKAFLRPRYFTRGKNNIRYDFGLGFFGGVRITLRGAKSGETININGNHYVCNGELDEQATFLYLPTFQRQVDISGGQDFDPSQITKVEAIVLTTPTSNSF